MKNLKKGIDLCHAMDHFIKASASGRRRKPDGFRISAGTIVNYRNTLRLLIGFYEDRHVHWEIDTSLKQSALQFRKRKAYWERFWRQFSDYLYARGCLDNYVASIFKNIRCLLHYLNQRFGYTEHQYLPYRWVRTEPSDFPVITAEQLRKILYDDAFYRELSPRLRRIRKIVTTGCLTALRASDLLNLRGRNMVVSDTGKWLVVNSQKTKRQTRMLMPQPLQEILIAKQNPSARLLPDISNVNLNRGIKALAEKAGWTWKASHIRKRRGLPVAVGHGIGGEGNRYCDQLTTHSLRRSAITLLLRTGMPETLVRKISGHQPGSREFHRYVAISQDWLDEQSEKAFHALLARPTSSPVPACPAVGGPMTTPARSSR